MFSSPHRPFATERCRSYNAPRPQNGGWMAYGLEPEQYISTWRSVTDAIRAVTNDTYMLWAPNLWNGPVDDSVQGYTPYWPGEDCMPLLLPFCLSGLYRSAFSSFLREQRPDLFVALQTSTSLASPSTLLAPTNPSTNPPPPTSSATPYPPSTTSSPPLRPPPPPTNSPSPNPTP